MVGAGFNEEQAEALIQFEINKDRSSQLNKEDIEVFKAELEEGMLQLDKKIGALQVDLKYSTQQVQTNFKEELLKLNQGIDNASAKLKIWFLTALLTQTFALGGLMYALLSLGGLS